LVIIPEEFHRHETHFFSLLKKTLSHYQKCLCANLLNTNETLRKLPMKNSLTVTVIVRFQNKWLVDHPQCLYYYSDKQLIVVVVMCCATLSYRMCPG
jgi:hypothetical protein